MTSNCQRWREHRDSYRPAGEPINTARYEVAPISMADAKSFVTRHHYSGSYPACRFRYGLFTAGQLVGVAVFSMPMSSKALTNVFPGEARASCELGRFVLLDEVPANGESWFLARCRELLRRESIIGVVAFSDDTPRLTADGHALFAGHIGTIYQASNAIYLGRGTARTLRLFPDGSVLSDRAISKIRNSERGHQYAVRLLTGQGAEEPSGNLQGWLNHWLPLLTRPLPHRGNHKYAWCLDKHIRLRPSRAYPKGDDHAN